MKDATQDAMESLDKGDNVGGSTGTQSIMSTKDFEEFIKSIEI